jgi:glycerol-3-phosphate acyltransferase PlsX
MKIAIDGMGGDFAPAETVSGCVEAAREYAVGILLVGPRDLMEAELSKHALSGTDIQVVDASEHLVEGEHPAFALRKKRDASVSVALSLVREGRADAALSAGPTGGVTAAAMMVLGTLEGMSRPVVGGRFLEFAPDTLMMDLGSNVDCQPHQLLDFAIIGSVYAEKMLGIPKPSVALLSVGAEEGKGNQVVLETAPLLKASGLNFIGNVEGYDIPLGRANVILCDGFVGNIVVKFAENLGKTICGWLEEKLKGQLPPGAIADLSAALRKATNAADAYGGGPLWAVNGIACVAHGRCRSAEIAKAIGQAKLAVEQDLVGAFKEALAEARKRLDIPGAP